MGFEFKFNFFKIYAGERLSTQRFWISLNHTKYIPLIYKMIFKIIIELNNDILTGIIL